MTKHFIAHRQARRAAFHAVIARVHDSLPLAIIRTPLTCGGYTSRNGECGGGGQHSSQRRDAGACDELSTIHWRYPRCSIANMRLLSWSLAESPDAADGSRR
jgi:hypothetical protein